MPDFRNMGVMLRIVVAVNLMAVAAALIKEERWDQAWLALLDISASAGPHLLVEIVVLYLLAGALSRLPYRLGVLAAVALTLAIGALLVGVYQRVFPAPPSLLRYELFCLVAAIGLLGYFNLRNRALSPALAEARLQALQARIRPHFLFNSINAVLSLVRHEPRRAEMALEDMADLFRVLMRDNRDLRPLADEVELCRQYLGLEQLRLSDRLQVEWHIDKMPGDALVPPLVLQPLLENAVYHGVEPAAGPGMISINIFLRRGEVHAVLRNPVRAAPARQLAGNRMALQNIRERLALHFDAEAAMEVKVTDGTYRVHIRMPYRPAADVVARKSALAAAHG